MSLTCKAEHGAAKTTFLAIGKMQHSQRAPLRTPALGHLQRFSHIRPEGMASDAEMRPAEAKVCGWGATVCTLELYVLLPVAFCAHAVAASCRWTAAAYQIIWIVSLVLTIPGATPKQSIPTQNQNEGLKGLLTILPFHNEVHLRNCHLHNLTFKRKSVIKV